jgi:hypothetical protein
MIYDISYMIRGGPVGLTTIIYSLYSYRKKIV